MFIRFRNAIAVALLLAAWMVVAVSAKGGYSFITIAGEGMHEAVRTSDTALTEDFFVFADFYRDRVEAPAEPGTGYEITRYYVDGNREIAFDRLHYYPATGFVYYDGIVDGSSEYDKKWYAAKPEIKTLFESVLVAASAIQPQTINPEKDTTSETVTVFNQPNAAFDRTEAMLSVAIAAGLALFLLIFFSRQKVASP